MPARLVRLKLLSQDKRCQEPFFVFKLENRASTSIVKPSFDAEAIVNSVILSLIEQRYIQCDVVVSQNL